jgi:hypothetical protein
MDDERSPADRAADFTRQLNDDQVSRQLRENTWGSADLVDFKNLKFDGAGSGRGPNIRIGSVALVAGCGALLGLLLGRDERILTAIVFALIAGGTVAWPRSRYDCSVGA